MAIINTNLASQRIQEKLYAQQISSHIEFSRISSSPLLHENSPTTPITKMAIVDGVKQILHVEDGNVTIISFDLNNHGSVTIVQNGVVIMNNEISMPKIIGQMDSHVLALLNEPLA